MSMLAAFGDSLIKKENQKPSKKNQVHRHKKISNFRHRLNPSFRVFYHQRDYHEKRSEAKAEQKINGWQGFPRQSSNDQNGKSNFSTVVEEFRQIFGGKSLHEFEFYRSDIEFSR